MYKHREKILGWLTVLLLMGTLSAIVVAQQPEIGWDRQQSIEDLIRQKEEELQSLIRRQLESLQPRIVGRAAAGLAQVELPPSRHLRRLGGVIIDVRHIAALGQQNGVTTVFLDNGESLRTIPRSTDELNDFLRSWYSASDPPPEPPTVVPLEELPPELRRSLEESRRDEAPPAPTPEPPPAEIDLGPEPVPGLNPQDGRT